MARMADDAQPRRAAPAGPDEVAGRERGGAARPWAGGHAGRPAVAAARLASREGVPLARARTTAHLSSAARVWRRGRTHRAGTAGARPTRSRTAPCREGPGGLSGPPHPVASPPRPGPRAPAGVRGEEGRRAGEGGFRRVGGPREARTPASGGGGGRRRRRRPPPRPTRVAACGEPAARPVSPSWCGAVTRGGGSQDQAVLLLRERARVSLGARMHVFGRAGRAAALAHGRQTPFLGSRV
jgi:hypothetical protein